MSAAGKKSDKMVLEVHDPAKKRGRLKAIGGSMADDWNNFVANQTVQTHFLKGLDAEDIRRIRHATVDAMIGIAPRDELEGMVAAQLLACHNAAMECCRRAMIEEQTFEGRRENLSQANKLSRTYATLLESLNRHRGKGQAEGYGRARPCPFRWAGRRGRCREPAERISAQTRGSLRCMANCPCTSADDAERGHGAAADVVLRRC